MQLGWIRRVATRSARWWPSAWASTSRKESISHPAGRPERRRRGDGRLRPPRGRPGVVEPLGHAGGVAGPADPCFAVGAQRHPYSYFSLPRTRCASPPTWWASGRHSADRGRAAAALLAKNKIAEKDVNIVPIGADMTPLLTGQVDVVTGWLTNTTALKVLGKDRVDMTLWDTGVKLYALPYYANTKTLQTQPHRSRPSCAPLARGWVRAGANRDQAVDLLVKEYPNLNREDERVALDTMLSTASAT
jgi:hypothetical protein